LAGASALLEGALVLATQPVRSRATPLRAAEQLDPGTAVVVVVLAKASGMAGDKKLIAIATAASNGVATGCRRYRPRHG
jgi:hypothetical protein